MSKQIRTQNRLKELFLTTELLECEPWKVSSWVEGSSRADLDAARWLLEAADVLPGSEQEASLRTLPEPDAEAQTSSQAAWNETGRDRNTGARLGWADYLDAIQRSEKVGFRYEGAEDAVLTSPLRGEVMENGNPPGGRGNSLTVPLTAGEESLGKIELQRAANRPWSEAETELVANIVQQMALHLDNLRLLSQADQFRQDAEQAVRQMTRQGWEAYLESQARQAAGYVYDRDQVRPLQTAPMGGNGAGRRRKAPGETPIRHSIRVRDLAIGELVVEASSRQTGQELLAAVADRLGLHIESLRLLEETERSRQGLDRRAAELETVARVSTAAATILEPQTLLQSVVDLTKASFKLYHAHIYLVDAETGELHLATGAAAPGQVQPSDQHAIDPEDPNSLVARAARTRSGIVLQDVGEAPNYVHYPRLPDTRSELATPMIVGDQVIGVFGVLAEVPGRFGEDDMRIFSTLAAQVAVALRNAELYAEQMATVARLRELDHLKSAFLANMSHELRTPLNSILGFAQVIMEEIDGPVTEDMHNDLGLIVKNGKYLLNLINDVLDMAKIEAGRMSLTLESFDLRELIEDALDTTSPLARSKGLFLSLEANPLEHWGIQADRFRLRQILLNLLGNAIKFTEQGGVTVKAEKKGEKMLVCIEDTGIGVPPDQLEKVFEAFSQVDTSTTRKAGGTGLGLPISRRLVELHGGRLWAESSGLPGEGAMFWLELPVETDEG